MEGGLGDVARLLLTIGTGWAKRRGLAIGDAQLAILGGFVEGGVRTMVEEGRLSDEDIALATVNLLRWVDELVGQQPAGVVATDWAFNETTFRDAGAGLCPGLWPFC
jgi:hypothetical protein